MSHKKKESKIEEEADPAYELEMGIKNIDERDEHDDSKRVDSIEGAYEPTSKDKK